MEEWKSDKANVKPIPVLSPIRVDRLGDCRIIREVGRGGMGVVFEGFQDPPGRRVAVKILPWQHSPDSPWREQFAHEARLAARLRHANIVPVYQYAEQAGFSYYVMPFIVGVGLDWIIQRLAKDDGIVSADEIRRAHAAGRNGDDKPPVITPTATRSPAPSGRQLTRRAWKKIAKIGVQAAAALRHAHRKGLLHRDIKPGNVLLDADGVVWITDFGLARQISDEDEIPGVAGTLRYMSPEHLVGSADERSDVYALGVTLHELCTLKPAFEAKTRAGLKQAIRRGEIIIPRTVEPLVPAPLEAVILKAAAADPQQRYQSADEFKSDLLRFLNGRRVAAPLRRARRT
jgi:serine/threonine protein kinase